MRKLLTIWFILFLSLSLGNVVPVIACEECTPGLEGRRGRREHPGFRDDIQGERILRYLEENRPEVFEKLTRLKERSPEEYQRGLRRFGGRIRGKRFLEDLKREDPERYEKVARIKALERESRQLAGKYREINDPEEKETIKADLKDLLSKLFDLRQEEREVEMKRLERKLERLQEDIVRRRENKELIVNRRLKEMTGEADYLRW